MSLSRGSVCDWNVSNVNLKPHDIPKMNLKESITCGIIMTVTVMMVFGISHVLVRSKTSSME